MSSSTLRFLAEPSTAMKWTAEAGAACATRWARQYCVTESVGSIRFERPIRIGDLVAVKAHLNAARNMPSGL